MVNASPLDLNLLRVFDAIRRTQSVTLAGGELGLTQPSISNALGRLRQRLDDPLFVRTPAGMRATPRAERLAVPVREALALIDAALSPADPFDPARAQRTFRISTSDLGETILLPPMIEALRAEAGRLRIETHPVPLKALPAALESGEIDLAMGALGQPARGVRAHFLFSEPYVCVMRVDHPRVRGRITLRMLGELDYALVAPAETVHRQVEVALRRRGLVERIAVRSPHFMALPVVLERSDLVGIVPIKLARHFCRDGRLKMAGFPLPMTPVQVSVFWHERFDHDAAHQWLRAVTLRLASMSEAGRPA